MTYHYGFDNLKHHGIVEILDIDGNIITDLYLWECEDFDKEEIQDMSFICKHCINKFVRKHKDDIISKTQLGKLGLISQNEGGIISEDRAS
jgi:hypothetical protein